MLLLKSFLAEMAVLRQLPFLFQTTARFLPKAALHRDAAQGGSAIGSTTVIVRGEAIYDAHTCFQLLLIAALAFGVVQPCDK